MLTDTCLYSAALRRLHLNLQLDRANAILSFPFAHLTYLEVIDATIGAFPSLPQLTTFLGYELYIDCPASRFFGSMPSLRVLALLSSDPLEAVLNHLPSTLRHLAYDDERRDPPWTADQRPLAAKLANNLISCTLYGLPPAPNTLSSALREACEKAGTRWTHAYYDEDWDSETWAWSVNAQ